MSCWLELVTSRGRGIHVQEDYLADKEKHLYSITGYTAMLLGEMMPIEPLKWEVARLKEEMEGWDAWAVALWHGKVENHNTKH